MIHNTTATARKHAHLQGRDKEIARLTESAFQDLLSKHINRAVDDRGQTHVENACLLLASHKVLLSFIRNNEEVLDALKAQAGAHSSAVLHYLLRFAMLFQRDPYDSAVRRLKALRLDFGRGFQTEVTADGRTAELTVHRCLYKDIFQEEDAMQLLQCCCCSQDSVWFEGLERQHIGFARQEWLGSSGRCCRMQLRQL
ncbi:g7543 [Coccomyxa viridis]|uniref:G7543 protein n=1 Tax=Coccomyxa viridis TaxID=1274662 RepID=A0ABP1FY41_9CHLO